MRRINRRDLQTAIQLHEEVTSPVRRAPTIELMGFVSSDPNAWLRPYWADLHQQPFFAQLAPELQAKALAEAVEHDHPATAAEIRAWNLVTRRAMLAVLDQALRERHAARETELWRVRKGDREVQCVAVYTTAGLDLRLLEAGEMLRTQLCGDAPRLRSLAAIWEKQLLTTGWSITHREDLL
jgi:hypothetical protein